MENKTAMMTFGCALEAAKKGCKISRRGWNGKGQYVFLVDGIEFHTNADLSDLDGQDVEVHDAMAIKTTSGVIQVGWLASQSDMLADDWVIVG